MSTNHDRPEVLEVSDQPVDLASFTAACRGKLAIALADRGEWRERIAASRRVLEQRLQRGDVVYGVNTAFGGSSYRRVPDSELAAHALSLVRQHGCGVGDALSIPESRGVMLARLVTLARGRSGVRLGLLELLVTLLRSGVTPLIPRWGSVGASGDLTPLSYVAALLAGEREALLEGRRLPAAEALQRLGLRPWRFAPKESLALMNGTSAMTAIGILAHDRLRSAITAAERATALLAEVTRGRTACFDPFVHDSKPHPGQVRSAAEIRALLAGSGLVDSGERPGRLVQDPYSLRCAPQVTGSARDAVEWIGEILARELNGVDDNPLVDVEGDRILFGGNFYGGHVAMAMDLLKSVAASLLDLADRQFALLVDSRFNEGLPETLVAYPGSGIKGLQITCSALAALAVQRAMPDGALSRPTEAGNQDKVSMGLNAALHAAEVVELLELGLAGELVALSNAAALRDERRISPAGRHTLARVRRISPVLSADRALDREIRDLAAELRERSWPAGDP